MLVASKRLTGEHTTHSKEPTFQLKYYNNGDGCGIK